MNPILKNILAVIAGLAAASVVNMGIVAVGGLIVAPPPGADMSTVEGIRAAMAQMTPAHFVMPLLAHALGTLAGGFTAAAVAATHKMTLAFVIGIVFLVSGAAMVSMVGGPLWFILCDLALAYVPMAWIGGKLGLSMTARKSTA